MTIPDDDRQYLGVMQQADKLEQIKPDYQWIRFDETRLWTKAFLAEIGPDAKIVSTYIFDKNSVTHFCEFTPSYVLHRVGTEFSTSREMTNEERGEIDEKIQAAMIDDDDTEPLHCSTIDERIEKGVKIPCKSQPVGQFVGCDKDVTIDEVREYYLGNPW